MAQQKFLSAIDELRDYLPLQQVVTRHTDRVSVLRVTCAYLKTHNFLAGAIEKRTEDAKNVDEKKDVKMPKINDISSLILQALDGFCILVKQMGDVLYVTETAAAHLGYSQVSTLGCHLSELISDHDWRLLEQLFDFKSDSKTPEMTASFLMGMNCRLPKRASGLLKFGKKAVEASAFLRFNANNSPSSIEHIIFYCTTLESGGSMEILINQHKFAIRLDLAFKIIFVESRAAEALGYSGSSLVDTSLYELIPNEDVESLQQAHRKLLVEETAQSCTPIVALLKAGGGTLSVLIHFLLHDAKRREHSTVTAICSMLGHEIDSGSLSVVQRRPKWSSGDWWTDGAPVGSHSSLHYAHTLGKLI